jgi:hypothetical protein
MHYLIHMFLRQNRKLTFQFLKNPDEKIWRLNFRHSMSKYQNNKPLTSNTERWKIVDAAETRVDSHFGANLLIGIGLEMGSG